MTSLQSVVRTVADLAARGPYAKHCQGAPLCARKKLAICVEVQCEYSVFQLHNAGIVRVRVTNFKFIGKIFYYKVQSN